MAKDLTKSILRRNHPDFIRTYVDYTRNLESPTNFHMWTAVSIIAGALQGKCHINMGHFKWKPNCFIVFVAPPGIIAKSTTSGVGTDLLRAVKDVHFGPSSCTWQALLEKFQEVEGKVRVGTKSEKHSCLTIEASELGTFINFKDPEMVDVMVDLWDGKDKPLVRKTRGGGEQIVERPWINLIGCTTPSWIQENMNSYSIGGGFTSRCIFVYGEEKRRLVAYPHLEHDEKVLRMRQTLIEDLNAIRAISGEFKLTDEALAFGTQWYQNHYENKPEHLNNDTMAGYAARKQSHMHKIAMCLSASRSNNKIIERGDLELALKLLGICEKDMLKVFSSVTSDRDAMNMQILIRILGMAPKGFERSELYSKVSTRMSGDAFKRAFESGVLCGDIVSVNTQDGMVYRLSKNARARNKITVPDINWDAIV